MKHKNVIYIEKVQTNFPDPNQINLKCKCEREEKEPDEGKSKNLDLFSTLKICFTKAQLKTCIW